MAATGTARDSLRGRGIAVHESFRSFVAMVADVTVKDGAVKVDRVVAAVNCSVAVNPDVIRAQVEGGIGYALGAALRNKITLTDGVVAGSFKLTHRSSLSKEMRSNRTFNLHDRALTLFSPSLRVSCAQFKLTELFLTNFHARSFSIESLCCLSNHDVGFIDAVLGRPSLRFKLLNALFGTPQFFDCLFG
jgi:hypothetical protein